MIWNLRWDWKIEIDHRQYKISYKNVTLTNSSSQFYIIYLEEGESNKVDGFRCTQDK